MCRLHLRVVQVALQGLGAAQAGDPQALLALAIAASGHERDAAAYRADAARIDAFVAANRAAVLGAADPWHQGYELLRAMHRDLLGGIRSDLGNYVLTQNSLPTLLDSGRYNCAMRRWTSSARPSKAPTACAATSSPC